MMQNETPSINGCIHLLKQGLALLGRVDDPLYTNSEWLPVRSGIGCHFRHCLDFYQSFLRGIPIGRIDYNQRERDALVERDRAFAMTKTQIIIAELLDLSWVDGNTPVWVRLEGDEISTLEEADWSRSSVMREIQFLVSHTVHHYALIALLLRLQGFAPDEEFGVAPSTLKHWRQEVVCVQ